MRYFIGVLLIGIIVFLSGCVVDGDAESRTVAVDLPRPVSDLDMSKRAKFDRRVRQYILPKRIVWKSQGEGVEVDNAAGLLLNRSGQVTLDSHNPCVLRNKGKRAGVVLDFGRELHGGVQFMVWHTKNNKQVRLRVRFGESVSEVNSNLHKAKNATNDHAIRDTEVLAPWLGTTEIGNTGFRFVRVDLVDEDSYVEFKSIRAVFIYRDIEYKGSFECNDERLNRIWETGAYTVHLNMQDFVWDGIKRDRLVWVGDLHPEIMTINTVFGYNQTVPASLDLARDETPLGKWMNGLSSYSIWWILNQHSWYMYQGDRKYLEQQRVYLVGLLEQLIAKIALDGSEKLDGVRFLDWPSNANKPAIHAGLQALMIMAMQTGAELCGYLGENEMKTKALEAAKRMIDCVPDPNNSKQAAAMMVLAGLADAESMNKKVLAVDGAKRMSTFYGYYVLQARAKAGDYQGCLDVIRRYWGAMLDLGATTFWEDFDLDWTHNAAGIDEIVPAGKKDIHGDFGNYCYKGFRHSLCHGWASGPTAWLSEHVLGIKVIEHGCKTIRIEPHLGDLKWAKGIFPTPMGVIKVNHVKKADGTIKSTVDAPKGIKVLCK